MIKHNPWYSSCSDYSRGEVVISKNVLIPNEQLCKRIVAVSGDTVFKVKRDFKDIIHTYIDCYDLPAGYRLHLSLKKSI